MTKDFARLERHYGMQVLVTLGEVTTSDGETGPGVVLRCDPGQLSVSTQLGPWPDDDEGRATAELALECVHLSDFARHAAEVAAEFAATSNPDGAARAAEDGGTGDE